LKPICKAVNIFTEANFISPHPQSDAGREIAQGETPLGLGSGAGSGRIWDDDE